MALPDTRPRRHATPLSYALWRLGERALPEIEKAAATIAADGYIEDERMYRILWELQQRKAAKHELVSEGTYFPAKPR